LDSHHLDRRYTTCQTILSPHIITSIRVVTSPIPILLLFSFLMMPPPPTSTLFPYTTLFRSLDRRERRLGRRRGRVLGWQVERDLDRKSTRLNSSHLGISYAVFCLKKKKYAQREPHSGPNRRRGDETAALPRSLRSPARSHRI